MLLLIGGCLFLAGCSELGGNASDNPGGGLSERYFLEAQSDAMRPEFAADLEELADAPRYHLTATADPASGRVQGQMRLETTNTTQEALPELVFRLYPNASSVYGGGGLQVERVTEGDNPLQTELSEDGTVLNVTLPRPLQPGAAAALDFTFSAQAPANLSRGYGIFKNDEILSLSGWYPILAPYEDGWLAPPVPAVGDALLADTSLYEVELSVPAGYQVVSTGSLASTTPAETPQIVEETAASTAGAGGAEAARTGSDGWQTWSFVSGPAREFTAAISANFQSQETRLDGVTLRIHALPAEATAVSLEEGLEMMEATFTAFSERFGPYPFAELDLVETDITIGGYEFAGIVYVDDDYRPNGRRADYEYILAHELAHQWWYNLAGNHTVDEPWLDEAHATYGALIYLEHAGRPAAGQRLLTNWKAEVSRWDQGDPVDSSALEFTSWDDYRPAVYSSGALFLDELRRTLGDERFFQLLQRFQADYRYQRAEGEEYLDLAEEIAGQDLSGLYQEFFH